MSLLENLKDFLDTEEGKKSMDEFCKKLEFEHSLKEKHIENLHSVLLSGVTLSSLIEKVRLKYNSDKYREHWHNKCIEPPEILYWLLFDYAEKYGRECDEPEWEEYSNMFTSALYFIDGYYISRMDGQGSFIQIEKSK